MGTDTPKREPVASRTRSERRDIREHAKETRRDERYAKKFMLRLLGYFACGLSGAALGLVVGVLMARHSAPDFSIGPMLFVIPILGALAGIVSAYILAIALMTPDRAEPGSLAQGSE
jgi:hypothetical protein